MATLILRLLLYFGSAPHCLVVASPAIMATSDTCILDFPLSACQVGP
jgi:hypothetical protein